MNDVRSWSVPLVLLTLVGCSSATNQPEKAATPKATSPKALAAACPTHETGFLGDAACIDAPSAAEGFQLHYGPTDYDDPDDVGQFIMDPGQEVNDCFFQVTPNDEDVYYGGYDLHMRPGSHHLIGQSRDALVSKQGFGKCEATDTNPAGLFAASQTPVLDLRIDPAKENAGLGRFVPAHKQAVVNFHVINSTPQPTLREAWLNYYYLPKDEVQGMRGAIDLNGGYSFNIQPGTHQTYKFSCSPDVNIRVLGLAAHMHAHSKRMTIYKVSAGKKTKLLENYSWEDPAQVAFDSVTTIPKADPVALSPGGDYSGDLYLTPDDTIQWECEILNDSDTVLTFRNEVYTGEMCLVGGTVVNADDPMTLTDFQCIRN